MIACVSAAVAGPFFSAKAVIRAGVQAAWRLWELGICSAMVTWLRRPIDLAWLATRSPLWKASTVRSVTRTSTRSRISRNGTEYQQPSTSMW